MLYWIVNLAKAWSSPLGLRLFGKRWWTVVDVALTPLYQLAWRLDRLLPFPPTNWLVVGEKPKEV